MESGGDDLSSSHWRSPLQECGKNISIIKLLISLLLFLTRCSPDGAPKSVPIF